MGGLPALPDVTLNQALPAISDHVASALAQARNNPRDARVNGELGMVLATYDQIDAALVAYRRARLLQPQNPRWPYLAGHLLGVLQRPEEAAVALREALKLEPDDPAIRTRLAEQEQALGNISEARRLYEEVVAAHPEQLPAHLGLGRLLTAQGDTDAALVSLRAALSSDSELGEVHYALAEVYRRRGDTELAAGHLAQSERFEYRSAADYDPVRVALTNLHRGDRKYMYRARRLAYEGRDSDAIAVLLDALEINSRNDAARMHLVWLYGRTGDVAAAEEHYRKAVATDANDARLHFNWGHVLRAQGRYEEAKIALAKAIAVNPRFADAHAQLGFVKDALGRPGSAEESYREALRLDPAHRNARWLLGRSLASQGDLAQAMSELRRSTAPDDARSAVYLRTLSAVYRDQGELDKARGELQRAQRLAMRFGNQTLVSAIEGDMHRLALATPATEAPR